MNDLDLPISLSISCLGRSRGDGDDAPVGAVVARVANLLLTPPPVNTTITGSAPISLCELAPESCRAMFAVLCCTMTGKGASLSVDEANAAVAVAA